MLRLYYGNPWSFWAPVFLAVQRFCSSPILWLMWCMCHEWTGPHIVMLSHVLSFENVGVSNEFICMLLSLECLLPSKTYMLRFHPIWFEPMPLLECLQNSYRGIESILCISSSQNENHFWRHWLSFCIWICDGNLFFVESCNVLSQSFVITLFYCIQILGIPFEFPTTSILLNKYTS